MARKSNQMANIEKMTDREVIQSLEDLDTWMKEELYLQYIRRINQMRGECYTKAMQLLHRFEGREAKSTFIHF